jgi:Na+-driven multidrug efflux pump
VLITSMFGIRLSFYFGFYPTLGADALWWSFSVSSASSLVMAALYYRFSKWRDKKLLIPGAGPPAQKPA